MRVVGWLSITPGRTLSEHAQSFSWMESFAASISGRVPAEATEARLVVEDPQAGPSGVAFYGEERCT